MYINSILPIFTQGLPAKAESANKSTPVKAAPAAAVDSVNITAKPSKDQLKKEVLYALSIANRLFNKQGENTLQMAGGMMSLIGAALTAYPLLTGLALLPAVAVGVVFAAFLSAGLYYLVKGGIGVVRTYKETARQAEIAGQRLKNYDAASRNYIINKVKSTDQRFGELMEKAAVSPQPK